MRLFYFSLSLTLLLVACRPVKNLVGAGDEKYRAQTSAFYQWFQKTIPPSDRFVLAREAEFQNPELCISVIGADSVFFTHEELSRINDRMWKPPFAEWDKSRLAGVRFITKEERDQVFKDRTKGWPYFHQHYGKQLRVWSAPIFLRDYQLCVVYMAQSCGGLCGSGSTRVYQKTADGWSLVKSYCEWVS